MKKIIIITAIIVVIMLLPEFATNVFAPPLGPPGGTGGGTPIGAPTGVPIDGGLGFLLAAGVAYGGKKLKDRKKAKAEIND